MSFSYWEHKTWLSDVDFTVAGSGITGLNCALQLRKKYPGARIIVLERGLLPSGASTKNAGFATIGSISEILDDLNRHSEEEITALVRRRVRGLQILKEELGERKIGYQEYGGHELFTSENNDLFEVCAAKLEQVNTLFEPVLGKGAFQLKKNSFGFRNIGQDLIYSRFEGQIDTGQAMKQLLRKVSSLDIEILNGVRIADYTDAGNHVELSTDKFDLKTGRFLIATNGFASELNIPEVKPARAQVLITEPLPGLHIKGTFHLDRGFYYFRNVGERLLLGGGRNLDFGTEETTKPGTTETIQNSLDKMLQEIILPGREAKVAMRWSGIMGVGTKKEPILKKLSQNVYCGVRLGGMGIAIGSLVGQELASLVEE